jgi:hypothetical protein
MENSGAYHCFAPATSDTMRLMILGARDSDMRSLILLLVVIGIAGVVDAVIYDGRYRREASYKIQSMGDDVRLWVTRQIR